MKTRLKPITKPNVIYYVYDKNNQLKIQGNYNVIYWYVWLRYIIMNDLADIVAFRGIYRYAVWDIETWITITKHM